MSALVDGKYTREQLDAAFNRVKPDGHWKDRIRATVKPMLSEDEKAVVRAAVIFYTGSVPLFIDGKGTTKELADGYYLTIGA
jgi:hypothetical protein